MKFPHRDKTRSPARWKPLPGHGPGGFAGHTWAVNEWTGKNDSMILGADRGSSDARGPAGESAAAPSGVPVDKERAARRVPRAEHA
jgi:hypothetical protein